MTALLSPSVLVHSELKYNLINELHYNYMNVFVWYWYQESSELLQFILIHPILFFFCKKCHLKPTNVRLTKDQRSAQTEGFVPCAPFLGGPFSGCCDIWVWVRWPIDGHCPPWATLFNSFAFLPCLLAWQFSVKNRSLKSRPPSFSAFLFPYSFRPPIWLVCSYNSPISLPHTHLIGPFFRFSSQR